MHTEGGTYEPVIALDRLREGKGVSVRLRDVEIALFLYEGSVYAIENLCPHQHVPVLAEGELEGSVLTCPMHGWSFDIVTGKCVHASCRLRHFEVRIEKGQVCVLVPDEEETWW